MSNKEKFVRKVLEIINKKHKTDFQEIKDEKIGENSVLIQANINGRNYIHGFNVDLSILNYKLIKDYARALNEVIKKDLIAAKK